MLEVIYRDLNNEQSPVDQDKVQCIQSMWQKFVRSAPPSYANPLALVSMKEGKLTVLEVTT